MSFYEHTLVAKQDLSSTEIDSIQAKYNDLINSSEGKVIKIEKWGLMSFARRIKNYNKGIFIHYKFEGNKKTLDKIKNATYMDNALLRNLTVKYKKLDLDKEYFNNNEKKK